MEKLKKLTVEQEEAIPSFIEKWLSKVKQPFNEAKIITSVKNVYKSLDVKEPEVLIFDSPIACHVWSFKNRNQLGNRLDNQLRNQIYDQLGNQLYNQLDNQLDNQLRNQFDNQLDNQLRNQLRNQLGNQLDNQLRNQIYDQLCNQLDNQLDNQLGNQLLLFWRITWLAWHDYGKFLGLKFELPQELIDFVENVFFVLPYQNICIVSKHPVKVSFENAKFHNETGKCVEFADGWGLHFINGISFPEDLWIKVVSKKMPFEEILKIKNEDQKVQAMKYGDKKKFLEHTKAVLLDKQYCHRTDYKLWKVPQAANIFSIDAYFALYKDPESNEEHFQGIDPEIGKKGDVLECMGWKRELTKEQFINAVYA